MLGGYIKFVQYKIIQQTSINCGSITKHAWPFDAKSRPFKMSPNQKSEQNNDCMTNFFFSIAQYSNKVILYTMYSSVRILEG